MTIPPGVRSRVVPTLTGGPSLVAVLSECHSFQSMGRSDRSRCADACYRLCTRELKQNNKTTVSLFVNCTWLQSVVGGDSSLALWMRLGAAMNAITAFGLHRDDEPEHEPRSRLYIQQDRITLGLAVGLDIGLSTFMGRPPALSYRYISRQMPLDVSVDVLLNDSIPLAGLIDKHGW